MLAVVQRVTSASVTVQSENYHADIGAGLVVLLGVVYGDGENEAAWIAGKIARLRIFADDDDKMNRSVQDLGGEILLVSQFTLAGDCEKGNRPSFVGAAPPELGKQLFDRVADILRKDHNLPVKTGVFGAMMQVALVNDGPVTILLDRKPAGV